MITGPASRIYEIRDILLDAKLNVIDDWEVLRSRWAQLLPRERTIVMLRFFRGFTHIQIAVGLSQVLRQTLTLLQTV
jgi:DNA-directed RNA polymerase specialized sigma24 family protein